MTDTITRTVTYGDVARFFGVSVSELKALTSTDREQLRGGIQDGSYTY